MVRKRDRTAPAPASSSFPTLPEAVGVDALGAACPPIDARCVTICARRLAVAVWGDYDAGERIDHVDGVTVEEAEHQIATRLFQNTAKVHFNQFSEGQGRFGRRLIYGGHVISLAQRPEFQRPRQRIPYRGDQRRAGTSRRSSPATRFSPGARSSVRAELPGRDDVGALRLADRSPPKTALAATFRCARARAMIRRRARSRLLGACAALRALIAMRLPADAALIVIDLQEAIDDRRLGPAQQSRGRGDHRRTRCRPGARSVCRSSISATIRSSRCLTVCAAWAGPSLQALRSAARRRNRDRQERQQRLRRHGARKPRSTSSERRRWCVCGVLTQNSVEATARHGGNLGYRVFVVADACWAVDKLDLSGTRWPADDVHALSLAHMHGEYASIVDTATAVGAAAMAKTRQRRLAAKAR